MQGLVDIGANLTSKRFRNDLPAVLTRASDQGVTTIVITGTSVPESEAALELARQYPGHLYATAGIHPHEAADFTEQDIDRIRNLAQHNQVVAIGETGLDFNRNFSPPQAQENAFEAQLELASEVGLPVFLHERDAIKRQLQILAGYRDRLGRVVAHCFTGDRNMLHAYLDRDLYIGITGWVCDERRGRALQQAVADIPARRLMIESDAPYLLPGNVDHTLLPVRRRNEPFTLVNVLQVLALLRGDDPVELARQTAENSRRFFNLPETDSILPH